MKKFKTILSPFAFLIGLSAAVVTNEISASSRSKLVEVEVALFGNCPYSIGTCDNIPSPHSCIDLLGNPLNERRYGICITLARGRFTPF